MMNQDAVKVNPPFKIPPRLIDEILSERCVAFIGSGLSRGAGLPDWRGMMLQMLDWCERNNVSVNPRIDLEMLIERSQYLNAAEVIKHRMGKEKFRRFMTEVFLHADLQPTENHVLLTQIPFSAIVTTNYDGLIEKGFAKADGSTLHTFTHADTAELSGAFTDGKPFLLKAHGSINRVETIILTRNDYRQIIYKNPAYRDFLKTLFKTRTIFFLGFGLSDPDMELLLDEMNAHYDGYTRTHFALMSASQISTIQAELYVNDYGIEVIFYHSSSDAHREVTDFLKELARQTDPKKHVFSKLLQINQYLDNDPKYDFTVSTNGSVSIGPKDIEAYQKEPLSFSFTIQFDLNTPEGREAHDKWQAHQKTGAPFEVDARYIKGFSLPEPFDRFVNIDDLAPLKLVINPRISDESFPFKMEFTTIEGESISFDYLELRAVQQGTDEVTLSNQQQSVPLKLEFKLRPREKTMTIRWWIDKTRKLNVREALRIEKLFHLASQGGEIRLISAASDLPFAKSTVAPGQVAAPNAARMIRLLEALATIQSKAKVTITWPDREISVKEAMAAFSLARVLETGHVEITAQHFCIISTPEKIGCSLNEFKNEVPLRTYLAGENITPVTILDLSINLGPAVTFQDFYITSDEWQRIEGELKEAAPDKPIEVNLAPYTDGMHEARLLNFLPDDELKALRNQFPFLFKEADSDDLQEK